MIGLLGMKNTVSPEISLENTMMNFIVQNNNHNNILYNDVISLFIMSAADCETTSLPVQKINEWRLVSCNCPKQKLSPAIDKNHFHNFHVYHHLSCLNTKEVHCIKTPPTCRLRCRVCSMSNPGIILLQSYTDSQVTWNSWQQLDTWLCVIHD